MKKTAHITSNFLQLQCVSYQSHFPCKMLIIIFLFPFACFSQLEGHSQVETSTIISADLSAQVESTLRRSARKFEIIENKGQEGLAPEVLAYFSTGQQVVFIEKDRLRVILVTSATKNSLPRLISKGAKPSGHSKNQYAYQQFEIKFIGASANSRLCRKDAFDVSRNFAGRNPRNKKLMGVSSFEELLLQNIYPATDLRIYSQSGGQLEFDWICWPGADLEKVRMKIKSGKSPEITKDGSLRIRLLKGEFKMRLPESYYVAADGKIAASVDFRAIGNDEIGFRLNGKRKSGLPLVVDPDLLWGSFFDGGNALFDEYLYAIEFNPANQLIYCAGVANLQISSVYAAALSGAFQGNFTAGTDVLVYALTANGQKISFITYLGGSGTDLAIGLSIFGSSVFVNGYTSSSDYPVTTASAQSTAAFDNSYNGNTDGFVSVFNDSLNRLIYSTYLGAGGADQSFTIRAQSASSFTISLLSTSSLPATYLRGAADASFGGTAEAWIGRFTSFNNLYFGTYIGGTDYDCVNDFQLLSDASIVFAGFTKQITEVNASVAHVNSTKYDGLFGRINISALGVSSFSLVEKFGGTGTDQAWGILSLGDTVSVVVGQTNSTAFPLGSDPGFQTVNNGSTEGFIARFNNTGTGAYTASYTGGSGTDILVTVRPIILQGTILLMSFGSTNSANLPTLNFNSESFYSAANAGGLDMMFLICDLQLQSKYYLSYIGGADNDYLGKTGTPLGSNHMYYNEADSVLYVGTTTHSSEATQSPRFVGRGAADMLNNGIPVFDQGKFNGINDAHLVMAISTKSFIEVVMAMQWEFLEITRTPDCKALLHWKTSQETGVEYYRVDYSTDRTRFIEAGRLKPGAGEYRFTHLSRSILNERLYYRVVAVMQEGRQKISSVHAVSPCDTPDNYFRIVPGIISQQFTVQRSSGDVSGTPINISCYDISGKRIGTWHMNPGATSQECSFPFKPMAGVYLIVFTNSSDPSSGMPLSSRKVIVSN